MGEEFFKEILEGLDVEIVVKNKDGQIVYKNAENVIVESLDIVKDDIYIDRVSKKQYQKNVKQIGNYFAETYHDVTKFLNKDISLDLTDENVIVKDENGNIVYNNISNDMMSNLKLLEKDIYFYPSSNRYFQKHLTVSGKYKAEVYHDVTEFIEKADKYTIDGLTGLPVRAKVNEYMNEISKKDSKYMIAMMDIDNFKRVNDTYGHPVGDEVLKKVASIIKNNTRGNDFAGRYGGEEFIMFFETDDIQTIIRRLNFIRVLISQQQFSVAGYDDFNVTVSIGVSKFNSNEDIINDSINEADQALYYVKHNGKNGVSCYNENLTKTNVK